MANDVSRYAPRSGRRIKEDNTVVNTADMIESLYKALVVDKNAGIQLTAGTNKIGKVQLESSSGLEPLIANPGNSDGQSGAGGNAYYSGSLGLAFNNASWDRQRNNTTGTLLASAARTVYTQSTNQTNYNAKGVQVTLNVTSVGATGGLVVYIKGIDPVSGSTYLLHPQGGITINSVGLYTFELYPGASGVNSGLTTGNIVQRIAGSLPRAWVAAVGHVDSTSYTYSLGYSLIL